MHVENGRDIFITIFGEYKPSVFGFQFETLMKLSKPITEYDLYELMSIEKDDKNEIMYHEESRLVPKQLFRLIDHLYKNGLKVRDLFTVNRKFRNSSRLYLIRDWLDEQTDQECREYFS